jgi:nitrile hydratase
MSDSHNGHDHHHPSVPDQDGPGTYYQTLEIAVRELLIEKDIFTADDVRREVEKMDQRTPAKGAAVVARAWTDPAFKERLLENGTAACEEMGLDMGQTYFLVALENTETVHNVIVCTLCSCYPRTLIGLPPDWYKSRAYRTRVVRDPREVLKEFGLELPESTTIRVHDSTADMRYIVLPRRPEGTEGMSEEELAALVTRDCFVGVAVPRLEKAVS